METQLPWQPKCICNSNKNNIFVESKPQHDKTNKVTVRPLKTQISLGIRPVWSESSLCAQWVAKDPSFLHADSEDWSDWADAQSDLSVRWAHSHFVGFVMSQLFYTVHFPALSPINLWGVEFLKYFLLLQI